MEKPQIVISPVKGPDVLAAGNLMESMWRLHGQKSNLVDEQKIVNVSGNDYIKGILKNENATVFVAKVQGIVVGVASCIIQPLPSYYANEAEAYIDDISVSPEYQRQGVASMLVRACKDFSKSKGIKVLSAKVWSFNHPSASLMERNGFSNDYSLYHKLID